jgi:hypothetical protein
VVSSNSTVGSSAIACLVDRSINYLREFQLVLDRLKFRMRNFLASWDHNL